MRLYSLVEKVVYRITRIANGVGVCALTGMLAIMTIDIILRNFLQFYIQGVFELVELMCAIFISFALSYCAIYKGHIIIDIVTSHLNQTVQRVLRSIMAPISIVVAALLASQALRQGIVIQASGLRTTTYHVPIYPFYFVLFVGFALLALVWIVQLRENFSGEVTEK